MERTEQVDRKPEDGGVETWILRHPPVNAISTTLLDHLEERIANAEADPACRAVVITGEGAYFSAGADLKEMARADLSEAPELVRRGQGLFSRLEALRAPVVAAINGLAVGGGLELALACDLRVAADSAKLGAPEVNYGLMPAYGGTQRLLRLIGPAKARELVFTGSLLTGTEAGRVGLVNRTAPAGQEVRAARDLAHTIAQRAPRAVAAAKRAFLSGRDRTLAAGLQEEAQLFESMVLPSEDLAEGIAAFVERRPPKFRGA